MSLKRYNEFIKTNEMADPSRETEREVNPVITPERERETTPAPTRRPLIPAEEPSINPDPLAELEEEGGDLKTLSYELEGSELSDNVLNYDGHRIEMPSETNTFIVDGYNLKSRNIKDVINYLNDPEAQSKADERKNRRLQGQSKPNAQNESKSYKDKFIFEKRKK